MVLLPPASKPHACMSVVVIVSTMAAVDVYLMELSAGAGAEARSPWHGYTMALWFLCVFTLEIKLYFIYQGFRADQRTPDPLARHTLTLLLSICIPSLYVILVATEHLQHVATFRRKEVLHGRLLWVVVDLLEMQASLWEPQWQRLPLWAEGLTFFYCYILLLVLPCMALGGMDLPAPPRLPLYLLLSLLAINLATLAIRAADLLLYRDQRVSAIFMAKNLLAIALKGSTALQYYRAGAAGLGELPPGDMPCHTPRRGGTDSTSGPQFTPREF
uniref:Transmembrane protein 121 n=1 Tax=Gopherus evgoodei TaxID=1825980 RepID=A0A8C4WIJ5_9SAUR